jgi:hypothetical protein
LRMCQDILASETSRVGSKTNQAWVKDIVKDIVQRELRDLPIGTISEHINIESIGISEAAVV